MDLDERLALVFGSAMDAGSWAAASSTTRDELIQAHAVGPAGEASALRKTVLHQVLFDRPPEGSSFERARWVGELRAPPTLRTPDDELRDRLDA